jgi:hypothetical protein
MAGIKETKNQLRNDIQELYKRFTATKPEEIISNPKNANQLNELAELSAALTKKIEAFSYLAAIEETYPEIAIVPPVPEVKAAEIKTPEMKVPEIKVPEVVPPVAEIKFPEAPPVIPPVVPPVVPPATNIPLVPEIKTPEPVQPPAQPVKKFIDLKTVISFNEKLMFMRNLFNGDSAAYDNAIAQVNNSNSFSEAEKILKDLSATYKWTQDAEPVQVFYSSVKRRFA